MPSKTASNQPPSPQEQKKLQFIHKWRKLPLLGVFLWIVLGSMVGLTIGSERAQNMLMASFMAVFVLVAIWASFGRPGRCPRCSHWWWLSHSGVSNPLRKTCGNCGMPLR